MLSDRYTYFLASGSSINTTVKTQPGVFKGLIVGQCTSTGTCKIIDGSGSVGNVIALVNVPSTSLSPTFLDYDVMLQSGLSVQFLSFAGVLTLIYK